MFDADSQDAVAEVSTKKDDEFTESKKVESFDARTAWNQLANDYEYHRLLSDSLDTLVEWPTGADFDPETLYYWDRYMPAMKEMAEGWRKKMDYGLEDYNR